MADGMQICPHVSVVIPVFNEQDIISDCVNSVIEQAYPSERREIIVVDNASTDHTCNRLDEFGGDVTVIKESKKCPSVARNAGIRAASSELLAFLDADAVADPQWLRKIVAPFSRTSPGQTGGAIMPLMPQNAIQDFGRSTHNNAQAIAGFDVPYVIGTNFAMLRSAALDIGLFDETLRYGEDVDLSWRIQQAGRELLYVPEAIVYHDHERTLRGLFRMGMTHGIASTQTHKVHKTYLSGRGYRRNSFGSMRRLFHACRSYIEGSMRTKASCTIMFEAGKTLGKFGGAIRYGYLDL